MAEKDKIKNSPPLLGRYRLLKEKQKSTAYRSFLAYDLKLKRGVIVKLIPVRDFHKKNLPGLWQFLEKVAHSEQCISKVVELDYQNDSILVVEEYLEGRYFNTKIFEDQHDYERFENIMYRCVDLLRRLHGNNVPHGFIDFKNIKITPTDGVVLEDYPILHWLENHNHLPQEALSSRKFNASQQDIRQVGLILFNLYRTQLVPEFHAFPEKYTRKDIYDFFRQSPLSQFSDLERFLARLLLAGEPPKGFTDVSDASRELKELVGTAPPPVRIREKTSALGRPEKTSTGKKPQTVSVSSSNTQDLAEKLGKPVIDTKPLVTAEKTPEKAPGKKPEIYTRKQLNKEILFFRLIAWISVLLILSTLAVTVLYITRGFLASSIPEIPTPDFIGLSFEEASSSAEKLGLEIKISGEEYSEELPRGMIIEHQPPAGARIKKGRMIYVVVSKGLAVVEVPNVIDMPEDAAEDHLVSFQLDTGRKEYVVNEGVPVGIVMDQNPSAGEKVAAGEKINLTISAGVLKMKLLMPSLQTMTLSEALNVLEQKKLQVRKINRTYSPYYEKDTVTSQNPPEGEEVYSGMKVDLEVVFPQRQRPLEEFQVMVNVVLPDFDGRKYVKIINRNQRNSREIHNRLHSGRDEISTIVDGYGRTTISVYLDDELIREETF